MNPKSCTRARSLVWAIVLWQIAGLSAGANAADNEALAGPMSDSRISGGKRVAIIPYGQFPAKEPGQRLKKMDLSKNNGTLTRKTRKTKTNAALSKADRKSLIQEAEHLFSDIMDKGLALKSAQKGSYEKICPTCDPKQSNSGSLAAISGEMRKNLMKKAWSPWSKYFAASTAEKKKLEEIAKILDSDGNASAATTVDWVSEDALGPAETTITAAKDERTKARKAITLVDGIRRTFAPLERERSTRRSVEIQSQKLLKISSSASPRRSLSIGSQALTSATSWG